MRPLLVAGAALVAALGAGPAAADSYAREHRVAYLARALDAVRRLGPAREDLTGALQTGARRRCGADRGEPSIACLIDLARAHCDAQPPDRRAACHLAADVAITNLLSESELVDQATRVRFVQGGDFRASLRAALQVRRAALAAELALAEPDAAVPVAARIDRFCAGAGRELAWQRCAAALVWYVAEQGEAIRGRPAP